MIRKYCKMVLSFAAAILSFFAFADRASVKAAMKFATGGEVTSFRYTDPSSGVGYTAFVHTFTNTAAAAEFQNMSGKTLPVRLLVVGGGGAGMEGMKSTSNTRRPGGGGGGGGGVTETNTFLSADDVWTICVGAGGTISSRGQDEARGEAGTSSVSNGVVEVVSVPGGGAGGSRENGCRPTVGAAGGGGSGNNPTQAAGAEGNYVSSVGGVLYGPYKGGWGGSEKGYGGGGGGAGANGAGAIGGEGLASDITGVSVVYGSGGGGGGHCRVDTGLLTNGGEGGTNAGNGGNWELDIVDDGAVTNIVVTKASVPIANTGAGGAGGVSFGGGANDSENDATLVYATEGADGVVIIRYDIPDTPCIGGDVVTVTTNGFRVTYIHTFTNTTSAATFKPSIAFDGTSVRMLVVGGGGAGADGCWKKLSKNYVYGGGGGGGGGVTETNALLSVGDVWTIRVGAGGDITNHTYDIARGEAGASSVSNGVEELVLTPGGGAGGSRFCRPTAGAAGGGGSGESGVERAGASGEYTSSTFFPGEIGIANPSGGTAKSNTYGEGGGGGGAGANGSSSTGGVGLKSDITGEAVVYGSGGGGGGYCRDTLKSGGSDGGENAGNGGKCYSDSIVRATDPKPNTGSGGGGGASFGGTAYSAFDATYAYGTSGADGVVIIRYEVDLPRPKGLMVIFH